MLLVAAILAVGQVMFLSGSQHASAAVAVSCGQTITASTTLTADIGPCPGHGIIIGKGGITLNLGGHTITGNDTLSHEGIVVGGVNTVTITNGTVRDFEFGVYITTTTGTKVTSMRATSNVIGIYVNSSNTATLSANTAFSNTRTGIQVADSTKVVASGNTSQSNTMTGMFIGRSTATTFSGNKVTSNNTDGIYVDSLSTGTILTSNLANSNAGDGVQSDDPTAKFTTNTADYNGGLGLFGAPGTVDGGGNHGQDNTSVRQCANVVCLPV